jgi:hypothetical protein
MGLRIRTVFGQKAALVEKLRGPRIHILRIEHYIKCVVIEIFISLHCLDVMLIYHQVEIY